MTRRSFIDAALKAAAGFAILPSAVTYARAWKPATRLTSEAVERWFRREDLWLPTPPALLYPGMLSFARDPETGLVFSVLNGSNVSLCGRAWVSPLALPDLNDALRL